MSKVGNYIVGASVVAVMAGAPENAEAQNVGGDNLDNNKVERVEDVKEVLKNDSAVAWEEAVRLEKELKEKGNNEESKEELKETLKEDSWEGHKTIRELGKAPRIENLEYQTDTISKERVRKEGRLNVADAYYDPIANTITDNIMEVERGKLKSKEAQLSDLAHEVEHMHQYAKVNFKADMSLEQHYKLHCYKEMGANIAGLLQFREMYKEAKTDEERKNIIKEGRSAGYGVYFRMVENGEINPNSNNKEDFDKEMSFIANEVSERWMRRMASRYDETHLAMVISDIGEIQDNRNVMPNDENYKEGVRLMMSIGGIDFSKYLEKDIECYNKSIVEGDKKIQNGNSVFDFWMELMPENKSAHIEKIENLKGFSLEQQYNLAVQKYLVSELLKNDPTFYMDVMKGGDNIEYFVKDDLQSVFKNKRVSSASIELMNKLAENEGVVGKASDKEYQEKLREIWTVKDGQGNNVCLLDGMGGRAPDVSLEIASPYKLKKLDERSWIKKATSYVKSKLKKGKKGKNKVEKESIGNENSVGIVANKPIVRPDYEVARQRSDVDVVQTSEVIDTRTDYLKEERERRIEKAKKNLNEELSQIHPRVEPVKENKKTSDVLKMAQMQQIRNGR